MSEVRQVAKCARPYLLAVLVTVGVSSLERTASAAGMSQMRPVLGQVGLLQSQPAGDAQAKPSPSSGNQSADNQSTEGEDAPFLELNEALSAARSRLAELTKAAEIAKVAGDLRKELEDAKSENGQLKSVLSEIQAENSELQTEKLESARQLDALDKAASEAAGEAGRLNEELTAARLENRDLITRLESADTAARQQEDELENTHKQLSARVEALTTTTDETASEIARLTEELDETKKRAAVAEEKNAELNAALDTHQQASDDTKDESARLARDLDGTITELGRAQSELKSKHEDLEETKISLAAASQETQVLREQLATNRDESGQLRNQLDVATAEIQRIMAINIDLQDQVGVLKSAAGEATNAARLNLIAVEDQINEINAALASVKDGETLPGNETPSAQEENQNTEPAVPSQISAEPTTANPWVPRPTPARKTVQQQLIAAASSDLVAPAATTNPLATRVSRQDAENNASASLPPLELAALVVDLPSGRQDEAQSLLAELNVEREERGLTMTVPGALLFAVDSDKIEPSAHDELGKVAGLLNLYDGRNVLIVGHTDAVGDGNYTQQLSERRAALVKAFFVDNFQIVPDRLSIEGLGEQHPIASNATFEGRNINRRIEVVILD